MDYSSQIGNADKVFFYTTQNYIANPKDNKDAKEVKSVFGEKSIYRAMVSITTGQK